MWKCNKIVWMMLFPVLVWQSCTDVVDVDLAPAEAQLVVDAWIDNRSQAQTIRLTLSQPYFQNTFAPAVTDAEVRVIAGESDTLTFDNQGNGNYVWLPAQGETIGDVGMHFMLWIQWRGERYVAESEMRRVPEIDSIHVEYRTDEFGFPDGHYASFFARDLPGIGDTYWIKTYKNGEFLNKPLELNLAYDASFDRGGGVDGIIFILPIREGINRFPDPDSEDDFDVPPYAPGDEIRVEIHSIAEEAFFFLETARDQMSNGDNTIFAIPVANTKSNIRHISDQQPVLGFFCTSAVSEKRKEVQ